MPSSMKKKEAGKAMKIKNQKTSLKMTKPSPVTNSSSTQMMKGGAADNYIVMLSEDYTPSGDVKITYKCGTGECTGTVIKTIPSTGLTEYNDTASIPTPTNAGEVTVAKVGEKFYVMTSGSTTPVEIKTKSDTTEFTTSDNISLDVTSPEEIKFSSGPSEVASSSETTNVAGSPKPLSEEEGTSVETKVVAEQNKETSENLRAAEKLREENPLDIVIPTGDPVTSMSELAKEKEKEATENVVEKDVNAEPIVLEEEEEEEQENVEENVEKNVEKNVGNVGNVGNVKSSPPAVLEDPKSNAVSPNQEVVELESVENESPDRTNEMLNLDINNLGGGGKGTMKLKKKKSTGKKHLSLRKKSKHVKGW